MTLALTTDRFDPAAVLLLVGLAMAASTVGLGLARRLRHSERRLAVAWCLGGSMVMGTSLWAMHFIGMQALRWPAAWDPAPLPMALSWLAAVGVSALALMMAGRPRLHWPGMAAAAVSMGAGVCAMQYAGMAALPVEPGTLAPPTLLAVSPGAAAACAAALLLGLAAVSMLLDKHLQARTRALDDSLQAANDELRRAVLFDSLTSLPNRRQLFDRLHDVAQRCDRDGTDAALLFIDLDGFKPLNDLFGHGFGDAVLCEVAHRLKSVARAQDTVARLGGDEFVILLADIGDPALVHQVAMRVVVAMQAPLQLGRREARLSASVGIALYPADGAPNKLLAAADAAMYIAKRGGGGQAVFFAAHMEADTREQMELQRDLRLAIDQPERGELSLHYQPKVSARDGRITGVEALLRWRHPVRGAVGPVVFIPVAERFGLIDRLGAWVIEEACRQMCAWDAQGLRLKVAVNLSMHQLRQPGLVARVQTTLARHGLPPSRLMFEITESVAMDDADATGRIFDDLAALGTELAIDDFGTGYSSLAYLRRLPSRQVKIDRSFVSDLGTCSDAMAIVEAVIRLAHALGLTVVAEGVETATQHDLLRQLQCDELQGYLFARPAPGDTVMRWALGMDRPILLRFDDAALGVEASTAAVLTAAAPLAEPQPAVMA